MSRTHTTVSCQFTDEWTTVCWDKNGRCSPERFRVYNSASHGNQAEEYVPHPNDDEYYEESEIDEDENRDAYDDDNIPLTFEEWRIDFEARNAEATKRIRESIIATVEERQAEQRKSFDRVVKSMQTHIDRSIDYVLKSVQEDREKDKILQVGFFDSLIYQTNVSWYDGWL